MGKKLDSGTVALTTASQNIITGAGGDAAMRDVVKHLHFSNRSASDVTVSVYVGLTAGSLAGTGLYENKKVPANDTLDYFCDKTLSSTQFLTALASANSAITMVAEYEREVV